MIQLIAHRGRSSVAPENTAAAFEAALAAGFAWIETDVDLLEDGVPVLLHDDALERTTDGAGRVETVASPALRERDAGSWFSADFAGERVPLLSDLTGLMARTGLSANLELKLSHPTAERVERYLEAVAGEVEELAAAPRDDGEGAGVVVSSFDHGLLAAFRERSERTRLAPLFRPGEFAAGWRRAVQDIGASRVHPHHGDLGPRTVEELHDAGLDVAAWTVNDPARARQLADWGVEGVCTDGPAGMTPADWDRGDSPSE
ncbi:glycerophosphodiester phosphodiesterase family protein [Rothia halotolerans]|uniref:glycerophosphodiester phosphodiesterase family protein n=1 Tax=Rothia halotolerans TaxID=405770 RepID=UPI00101DB127|nr:glycerophosphodiester phosphodiesterase family protein [Rothia halotolerans]